jgi:Xaa-Pro aminopeptidase
MVVTIEPGIYLQREKLGCRIEDDVLITKGGPKVLTEMIPKGVKEVEAALSR